MRRYYYDLFASLEDNKGETCPGEAKCLSRDGRIGSTASRTLETYCRRGLCELWPTKPETVPADLRHLIIAADEQAEDAEDGYALDLSKVRALVYEAHKERQRALAKVRNRPRDEKGRVILTPDDPAFEPDGPPGDGSAINW